MKKIIVSIFAIFFLGCTYTKENNQEIKNKPKTYIEELEEKEYPKSHFTWEESSFKIVEVLQVFFYQHQKMKHIENSFENGKNNIFLNFCATHKSHSYYPMFIHRENMQVLRLSFQDFVDKKYTDTSSYTSYSPYLAYHKLGHLSQKTAEKITDDTPIEQLFVHYAINRIKEDPIKYFSNHKEHIYTFLSKEVYQKHISSTVNTLLNTYTILEKNNCKKMFDEMSKIKNLDVRKHIFDPELYEKEKKNIDPDDMPRVPEASQWQYSFWYRRYLNGNMKATYTILKEIQTHYENK